MAHKEVETGPLALLLEKAPGRCFSSPAAYLQHLLDTGHYPAASLGPEGPLACRLTVTHPPPRAEELCSREESEYFVGSRPQSRLTRSRTQLRIKSPSYRTGSRSWRSSITGLRTNTPDQDVSGHLLYACAHDLPTGLQLVLNSGCGLDLNATLSCANHQGLSPLAIASLAPTPFCCELLIKAGADVDWKDELGRTALHWAVLGGQVHSVRALLKSNASTGVTDREGFTPLLYAMMVGDHDIAASLLKEDCSLVSQQHRATGVSPLMLACAAGSVSLVKLLLKHNADSSLTDKCGHHSIHCGVWGGNTKCLLAAIPFVLALRDQWGRSPLMMAAAKGDTAMCRHLLKKGSRLAGEVDRGGRTPLHWAVLSCQAPCVQFLLDYTSEGDHTLCSVPDTDGAVPAHYAAMTGSKEILLLLKTKGASVSVPNHSGHSPLLWAAACGRTEMVQLLLEEDAEMTSGTPSGNPTAALQQSTSAAGRLQPLHAAACTGALEVCQLLLRGGAEANAIGPSGLTPLHYACKSGHLECASLLLSAGASVDSVNQQQESGLHLAAIHGYAPVVRELLASGALKERPLGEMQDWPVHLASLHGHLEVLRVLLDAGSGVDPPRLSDARTPLHLSAASGHPPCCQLLLARGADTRLRDGSPERLTALDLAMLHAHAECAVLLVAHGAPTAGGRIHRAAVTIQAVWKFHRYKRRREITQKWATVVLQRAVRDWLRRARARRVRERRERARLRAATLIQYRWRLYSAQRRRYQTTYARLKARLEQEHLATSIILTELHSHTHSISLPSAARASAPNPKALLKAASSPLPIFPSSSVLFPSQPRRPLTKKVPIITTPGGQAKPPLIATPGGQAKAPFIASPRGQAKGSPLVTTPAGETSAPVESKTPSSSKKQAADHMSSPFLPTIQEAREDELSPRPQPWTQGNIHLPALPSTPSLTAKVHVSPPPSVNGVAITRGSPKVSSIELRWAERGGKPRENRMPLSKSEVSKLTRANKISVTQSEPAVGTAYHSSSRIDSELREEAARERTEMLPPINQSGSVVSAATTSVEAVNSSTQVKEKQVRMPKLPLVTDDLKQQSTDTLESIHSKRSPEKKPAEGVARTPTANKEVQVCFQSQSHITRQTAFRDAPQGYKAPGHGKRRKEGVGATATAVGGLERGRQPKPQDPEGSNASLERELLHQAKRYDKLNQVLALLEQARGSKEVGGEQEGEGAGGKISELKDHIKTALDEAIRLRADTEALQTRAEGNLQTVL